MHTLRYANVHIKTHPSICISSYINIDISIASKYSLHIQWCISAQTVDKNDQTLSQNAHLNMAHKIPSAFVCRWQTLSSTSWMS